MKPYLLFFTFLVFGCTKPLSVPKPVETKWIDITTRSDTAITNVINNPGILYYALKSWQSSTDTSITHGYRFIAGSRADTVVVYKANDPVNSQGPFICGNTEDQDTLKSQNFLHTIANNPVRKYVHLK